jgi:hypothetical protein
VQNDLSHPISLSSESTRDNHCRDNESVALVGIEWSPAGDGGISSLSSSYSCSSKRPRIGRLRGGPFIPLHLQQMKLCTSDIPTKNAIAGQHMDIAVADFMHSHMLPFSLTECPKFLKLLNTAKSLGTGYLPPDRRKMSGPLLDMLYDTNKEEMIKNLLLESSKIFGVTIFGDGATITNVPLMNILAASPNNPFALLEFVDCTDQMAKGGKKDAKYLTGIVRPLIMSLGARAKSNIVDLIMFDGASSVQLTARIVARYHPRITVCHGAEHVISLFFSEVNNKV